MNTLLVASSKGGVGKTTIAPHLAAHAAVAGWRSVLVDADPQGSSMHWVKRLRPRTHASRQTLDLLKKWPYPVLAQLRDSQAYAVLAGLGKSLFDYHPAKVHERQSEWLPLLKWLRKHAAPSIPKRETSL